MGQWLTLKIYEESEVILGDLVGRFWRVTGLLTKYIV